MGHFVFDARLDTWAHELRSPALLTVVAHVT